MERHQREGTWDQPQVDLDRRTELLDRYHRKVLFEQPHGKVGVLLPLPLPLRRRDDDHRDEASQATAATSKHSPRPLYCCLAEARKKSSTNGEAMGTET